MSVRPQIAVPLRDAAPPRASTQSTCTLHLYRAELHRWAGHAHPGQPHALRFPDQHGRRGSHQRTGDPAARSHADDGLRMVWKHLDRRVRTRIGDFRRHRLRTLALLERSGIAGIGSLWRPRAWWAPCPGRRRLVRTSLESRGRVPASIFRRQHGVNGKEGRANSPPHPAAGRVHGPVPPRCHRPRGPISRQRRSAGRP